jgi:hypothetical protein
MGKGAIFYISHIESLLLTTVVYMILSPLLTPNQDYSSLQEWGLNVQFWGFVVTILLQLILRGNTSEEDTSREYLSAALSNTYCSLCCMIFLFMSILFAQSLVGSPFPVRHFGVVPGNNGSWYFHPTNLTQNTCTNGTWQTTRYRDLTKEYPCLDNNTKYLITGVHQYSENITATWFYQSDLSNAAQVVAGASQAGSGDMDQASTPPMGGSISFGVVWAYVSLMLLLSCYTAHSSITAERYSPLFLLPRALIVYNILIVVGIPHMFKVYAECLEGSIISMFVYLGITLFGDDIMLLLLSLYRTKTRDELSKLVPTLSTYYELSLLFVPSLYAYSWGLHEVLQTASLVIALITLTATLAPYAENLVTYLLDVVETFLVIPEVTPAAIAAGTSVERDSASSASIPAVGALVSQKSALKWNLSIGPLTKESRHRV